MTCTYCGGSLDGGIIYADLDGDHYCSEACRRDHILLSISRALFLIAGKGCCDD